MDVTKVGQTIAAQSVRQTARNESPDAASPNNSGRTFPQDVVSLSKRAVVPPDVMAQAKQRAKELNAQFEESMRDRVAYANEKYEWQKNRRAAMEEFHTAVGLDPNRGMSFTVDDDGTVTNIGSANGSPLPNAKTIEDYIKAHPDLFRHNRFPSFEAWLSSRT